MALPLLGVGRAAAEAGAPLGQDTLAYVTCQNGNAISVLDLASGAEVARWSVPGKPAGVALAPGGGVYAVAPDSKAIRHYAPDGQVVSEAALDGGPIGVVIDPARDRVFVSDWYNARIWVLNQSLELQSTLATGAAPAGLTLSADGRFLASADRDADQVSIFDAESLTLRHSVSVGVRPFGLRFAPDGRLFVGNVGSDDVTLIDAEQGEVLATLPVGSRPYGVAFAKGRAFVTNQYADSVTVIDLDSLTTIATLDVGEYPEGIDTTPDGAHVVLANWFENTVQVIDATTLHITKTIATADGPRAFGTFVRGGSE